MTFLESQHNSFCSSRVCTRSRCLPLKTQGLHLLHHLLLLSPLMKGSLLGKDRLSFCVPVELVVSHNLFSEHWHNLAPCHES